jgi:hypothetical protein
VHSNRGRYTTAKYSSRISHLSTSVRVIRHSGHLRDLAHGRPAILGQDVMYVVKIVVVSIDWVLTVDCNMAMQLNLEVDLYRTDSFGHVDQHIPLLMRGKGNVNRSECLCK